MKRQRPPVMAQVKFRENAVALEGMQLAEKFRYIHRTNMWGSTESTSGVGSTIDATEAIRKGIAEICHEFGVQSMLDAPCGDASWITKADLPLTRYVGVDIVPELIERNRSHYPGDRFEFQVADLTRDALPRCDLVLCRDCLVHLSFQNIRLVLENIRRSGAKYLLTTTFPEHDSNVDIVDGDWRLLNLEKEPFCFPPALKLIDEKCEEIGGAYNDKSLGFWAMKDIPVEG